MSTDLRHDLGRRGEALAAEHFKRLGYEVLARNHRTRFGELDLVLTDGDALVFCEVKTRRLGSGGPREALRRPQRPAGRRHGRRSATPSGCRCGAWPGRGWPR